MANMKFTPADHTAALKVLNGRDEMVIGHNTKLVKDDFTGEVFATYHGNPIVSYSPDGTVQASWAGWGTSTTTNRLNQLAPGRFNIKNRTPHYNGKPVGSSDWITVN